METLEDVVDAKARILLGNVQTQISKFKQCHLRDQIILKIVEIFALLDEKILHASTPDKQKEEK